MKRTRKRLKTSEKMYFTTIRNITVKHEVIIN